MRREPSGRGGTGQSARFIRCVAGKRPDSALDGAPENGLEPATTITISVVAAESSSAGCPSPREAGGKEDADQSGLRVHPGLVEDALKMGTGRVGGDAHCRGSLGHA